jgi:hypothetical protein
MRKIPKELSRKDFLKGMGSALAGATVLGGVGSVLMGCEEAGVGDQGGASRPAWPFSYSPLDGEKVARRAYKAFKEKGGCGIGVSEGFFGTLAEDVGYPFNQIPPEAFIGALGGYSLQNSLCGPLGVAATCIGSVSEAAVQKELISELFQWYKDHPFPQYQPGGMNLATTIAGSVICNDSVELYMRVQGCGYDNDKRKERCAGVAAEVARKTVELLNKRV